MLHRAASPTAKTLLLTTSLAAIAAGLVARSAPAPLLRTEPFGVATWGQVLILAGLFCLAEFCLLHVEVRRQAYSITLAGLPLAFGLLVVTPREVVLARLVGSLVAFGLQRVPRVKVAYNLAAYAAEAAIDATLLHAAVSGQVTLGLPLAGLCLCVVALIDQAMSVLVIVIIRWHQGGLSRSETLAVMLPALLGSAFASTGAITALLLSERGLLGDVALIVLLTGFAGAYRGYQILHRRHLALEHLHSFVALNANTEQTSVLARRMLEQTRSLMRAARAELVIIDDGTVTTISVSEQAAPVDGPSGRDAHDRGQSTDPLLDRVLTHRRSVRIGRNTRDPSEKAWLASRRCEDAVVAPLSEGTIDGALIIYDRLGDTGSFTSEDETLLQTLAAHLSVALRSSRLLDRLRHDATHDSLTGLANRALLASNIRSLTATEHPEPFAVLLLDLDRFKEVNDTLGHHVGDELLRHVAQRLLGVLPAGSTTARLGGDEFAVLIPGLTDPVRQAAACAEQLAATVARPIQLSDVTVASRASVGIALSAAGATEADLLRHADTAMYAAKAGQGAAVFYDAELDRGRTERIALVADLRDALERDELVLRYQPKLDLNTGQVVSVEALVRWQHPRLGLLSPDAFIPLAESAGLIEPLTHIVLRSALHDAADWYASGLDLTVAVNLSARSVTNPLLPELVSTALLAAGLPAHRLILEITESSIMEDADAAVRILTRLAAIGVTLSLDDFGTGYSSLAYLQKLPVTEVKIDRSFITGLTSGRPRSAVLVRTIIGLAQNLALTVVAEGVEDLPTLQLLTDLGCHRAQGYYISRPETVDELLAHLSSYPGVRPRPALHAVSG